MPRIFAWLSLSALCGCALHRQAESLRASYSDVDMPAVFSDGNPHVRVSGYAAGTDQGPIRFTGRTYRALDAGDNPYTAEGKYELLRDRFAAGTSLLYQGSNGYAGGAFGVSGSDLDHVQLGLLAGWSRAYGEWVPTLGMGAFYNSVGLRGTYLKEGVFTPDTYAGREALRSSFWDFSLPVKGGLMYRAGLAAPYATVTRTSAGFWPYSTDQADPGSASAWELALGCQAEVARGAGVFAEAGPEWLEVADLREDRHWNLRGGIWLATP